MDIKAPDWKRGTGCEEDETGGPGAAELTWRHRRHRREARLFRCAHLHPCAQQNRHAPRRRLSL